MFSLSILVDAQPRSDQDGFCCAEQRWRRVMAYTRNRKHSEEFVDTGKVVGLGRAKTLRVTVDHISGVPDGPSTVVVFELLNSLLTDTLGEVPRRAKPMNLPGVDRFLARVDKNHSERLRRRSDGRRPVHIFIVCKSWSQRSSCMGKSLFFLAKLDHTFNCYAEYIGLEG